MTPPTAVTHLGLCGNPRKDDLQAAIDVVHTIGAKRQITISMDHDLATALDMPEVALDDDALVAASDVLVALGGDGTMLRAARMIGTTGTPLLGINLGSLGYLTDIPLNWLPEALNRVLDGDYLLAPRARVHCQVWRERQLLSDVYGLNDVVVNMGPLPRTLDLELRLGGTTLGRWLGDGVIVATASGSTAYSLSAGGAICQPELPGMLVTPICPHSLGVRPLVVSGDVEAEIVVHGVGDGATLTADGQVATPLCNLDRLRYNLTKPEVNLVKFHDSSFFQVLRQKLHWGLAPRFRLNSRRDHRQPDASDLGPVDDA